MRVALTIPPHPAAGNHALGLAYHGKDLGVPITVIMPEVAPITKIQKCRALGANVVVQGAHIGESKDLAMEYVERDNLTYVNGYDHPNIIAGAGSIGLEVLDQVPDVEAVLVPLGGGGLIAGMSLAIKSMRPDVEVIVRGGGGATLPPPRAHPLPCSSPRPGRAWSPSAAAPSPMPSTRGSR